MRSGHGSDARPWTCAQPVMPGRRRAGRAGARCTRDLHRDGRTRADDRHLAAQHVDQVGQLVERRAAQERADARDARVPSSTARPAPIALGAADHRAQLVDLERAPVAADAALAVDRVARATPGGSRRAASASSGEAASSAVPATATSSARLPR